MTWIAKEPTARKPTYSATIDGIDCEVDDYGWKVFCFLDGIDIYASNRHIYDDPERAQRGAERAVEKLRALGATGRR